MCVLYRATVSTHSRLKAAGLHILSPIHRITGFNTQPPEGGWPNKKVVLSDDLLFQHTAA